MTQAHSLNRRALLHRASLMLGGSLSAPAMLGVLNGCAARPPAANWSPRTLDNVGFATVAEITDIMIPATETAGARDVGVPGFIDTLLTDVYPPADRDRYLAGLESFRAVARHESGGDFLVMSADGRQRLVQAQHDAAVDAGFASDHRPFILMTKELTLLGYFTSQPGATRALQYDPLPGVYIGCQALADAGNGRTWASEKSLPF
jgi:hypothetical protein